MSYLDPSVQRSGDELAFLLGGAGWDFKAILDKLAGWSCPWAVHLIIERDMLPMRRYDGGPGTLAAAGWGFDDLTTKIA